MCLGALEQHHLPIGVRARFVENVNGLRMHMLEAGYEGPGRPVVLLLHGFPELAYSWRKVMPGLAAAGYHVVAPDQRGYGRTTGWSAAYDQDLRPYTLLSLARDALALVFALGYRTVAAVVGHDFGAPVAAWSALTRPDVYQRCALLSAPFTGPPTLPFGTDVSQTEGAQICSVISDLEAGLDRLARPRKHYRRYYSTRSANDDMWHSCEGLEAFLRAYFHCKSADWPGNRPHPLVDASADELAKLPTYYLMDRDSTMPETVRPLLPSDEEVAANRWLPVSEMKVYVGEYARTGFQGGLNWYRAGLDEVLIAEQTLFSDVLITVPSMYISGESDWGTYQVPGAFDTMCAKAFAHRVATHLVPGAGHWVAQEQPDLVVTHLRDLLDQDC